ncbi:hypothetical protein GCM10011390_43750 [Aureimonas endophytica]|uniref:Flagellar protein FlgJ N-terminal domain-containing protein n=1 Tax=Aureimonas endophytica TaxID=2027858 RepID=A0A916ZZ63_9HYPH|nr:rod-binding protein [Aureimonas endophytica]GGE19749.1 hypothetical protein GCM10011390_43750 [Aureimonas endophytica]
MTGIKAIGAAGGLQPLTAPSVSGGDPASRALPYNMVSRGSKSGQMTPAQQFESFVLQSFIEPMLPKSDSSYFGEGTAGSIWKSMLAERLGAEMAAAGGIGIADLVEKRNASIEAAAKAEDGLAREAVAVKGASLGKPGSL